VKGGRKLMRNICVYCGGRIEDKIVTVVKENQGEVIIIDNVPAGVCTQCGEREYTSEVARKIETVIIKKKGIKKTKTVPVEDLSVI